jgi:hypothetical protein
MLTLRIIVIIACMAFMVLVCRQVALRHLMLKYSLLWLSLAVMVMLVALFPDIVYSVSSLLGFEAPSNFVFFVAMFFLLAISLSLSVVASRQTDKIKNLVQNLALLEKDIQQAKENTNKKI